MKAGLVAGMVLMSAGVLAQVPDSKLVFDAASVRPAEPDSASRMRRQGGPGKTDSGEVRYVSYPMRLLLQNAYGVTQPFQISAPAWMTALDASERYDIVAKIPAGTTKEQFQVMLRNLLVDRFGLVVHHETRAVDGWEMVVAKGGPKFKESAPGAGARPARSADGERTPLKVEKDRDGLPQLAAGEVGLAIVPITSRATRYSARQQPMSRLAISLENPLGKPVMDSTGLKGDYDFNLTFSEDERTIANQSGGPSPSSTAQVGPDEPSNAPPDLFT